METPSPGSLAICDAHVHIYDCFDLDRLLDCAWSNFRDAACRQGSGEDFSAALLLSEAGPDHWFERLAESADRGESPGARWEFRRTAEEETLLARCSGRSVLVVAGRQVVTAENLEVLALATTGEFPDGRPAAEVVGSVRQAGGIPVIPWGFGKWWGRRGRILDDLLESSDMQGVFLGDNSGRPWCLGNPRHFSTASRQQRRILPGSDPLPFPTEDRRAGSVGFHFRHGPGAALSAREIRSKLYDPAAEIGYYMQCERLLPFMRNQVAMQLRKRQR